jgi:mRNA-degrading endonuclease RelE of RelBE toxin-antitoxin system
MTYKILFSPEVFKEIELAECYFRVKRLDRSFLTDLNKQFIFLESFPHSRQIRYKNVRIHLLEKFNYSLHYTIENHNVYILHLLNQKQDF